MEAVELGYAFSDEVRELFPEYTDMLLQLGSLCIESA